MARDCSGGSTLTERLLTIARPKSSGWISYSRISPLTSSPTMVAAPRLTSSMPSRPYTTSACSAPSRCRARTWIPTRSGWNTPIRMFGAPAGLVSGPRMLKMVRTPSSLRTGATFFMAGWWLGANMKPMPTSAMHLAMASGDRLMFSPRLSTTSALPLLLETLRPPCLLTLAPAAAATNMEQVEMLNVCEPSPPVPTMSTRWVLSATLTWAAAVISPMVSFLTRRPVISAAIITGDSSPLMIMRTTLSISSWKISRCSMVRCSASWGVMGMLPPRLAVKVSGSASGAEESAHGGNGPLDARGVHVQMGHEAQAVEPNRQHALVCEMLEQARGALLRRADQVDEHDVGMGRLDQQALDAG